MYKGMQAKLKRICVQSLNLWQRHGWLCFHIISYKKTAILILFFTG